MFSRVLGIGTMAFSCVSLLAACGDEQPTHERDAQVVRVDDLLPGKDCAQGGVTVYSGRDLDGDGELSDDEVELEKTACDKDESAAAVSLASALDEPAGEHCVAGGKALVSGLDANGNGKLENEEISHTEYACGTVIAGDVSVASAADVAKLAGVVTIEGALDIVGDQLAEVSLPDLRYVGAELLVSSTTAGFQVSLPNLLAIAGGFGAYDDDDQDAEFKVARLSAARLGHVAEGVRISAHTIDLPALEHVVHAVWLDSDADEVTLPGLTGCAAMEFGDNLKHVSFPELRKTRYTTFGIALVSASFAKLGEVERIEIVGAVGAQLSELDLPSLVRAGSIGLLGFSDAPLTTLSLPKLEEVGDLFLTGTSGLESVDLPVLAVAGEVLISDMPALVGLKAPELYHASGGLTVESNPKLKQLEMPKLHNAPFATIKDNAALSHCQAESLAAGVLNGHASNNDQTGTCEQP